MYKRSSSLSSVGIRTIYVCCVVRCRRVSFDRNEYDDSALLVDFPIYFFTTHMGYEILANYNTS